MAFFIFDNDGKINKIAADTSARDAQNVSLTVKETSEDNFIKLKSNTHTASLSGDTVSLTELNQTTELTEENLKNYHTDIIRVIKDFEKANSSNSMLTACSNYKNYLESLDYLSLSFPLNSNWEKYCQDNSITYLHPLQIP